MMGFILGTRMPVRTVWMPASVRISSVIAGNFASRSRIQQVRA